MLVSAKFQYILDLLIKKDLFVFEMDNTARANFKFTTNFTSNDIDTFFVDEDLFLSPNETKSYDLSNGNNTALTDVFGDDFDFRYIKGIYIENKIDDILNGSQNTQADIQLSGDFLSFLTQIGNNIIIQAGGFWSYTASASVSGNIVLDGYNDILEIYNIDIEPAAYSFMIVGLKSS